MTHEIEKDTQNQIAANVKAVYDDEYIIKSLFSGKTRDDLAREFNHKNYRTLDMFMRRRGYIWDSYKQNYTLKPRNIKNFEVSSNAFKVDRILSLFEAGYEPMEIAKKVGMKDHRAMAMYMKKKGYIWSSEKQNYILLKGEQKEDNFIDDTDEDTCEYTYDEDFENTDSDSSCDFSQYKTSSPQIDESLALEKLAHFLPTLEIIERNKDKIADILSINNGGTIPRYVVGGITITKSLCMSHNLSELIKDFSREKNISQREIFEVAIIEFLKKYGYENEVTALFSS